ncbi:MAG TPA: hypothetical protein DCR44_03895 [Acholeplasmatales bacterium]|nr:MAG: hypothetical protein A2Y16_03405 [Tenericutes bacterium GWF2_57_13]HAQ56526.1 hypothetical protein [Acholeplasmatales bacterium]
MLNPPKRFDINIVLYFARFGNSHAAFFVIDVFIRHRRGRPFVNDSANLRSMVMKTLDMTMEILLNKG